MTGRKLHKEWIGRTPRSMPGRTIRLRICEAQDNRCACGCGHVFDYDVDQIDMDHKIALRDGGENRESNLQGLLRQHHVTKSNAEATARATAEKHKAKAFHGDPMDRRLSWGSRGFHKPHPQHTATREIIRKSDRRFKEEIDP